MSGYTDSEKIQYALKTALYRTMQTAMSDSASVERSAPLRVFPTNIMKVNIIEAGKGDIDEDGKYITGHVNAGTTANLLDPEGTVKNYKIICPVNNVITDKTISWLVSYGSSTKSYVDGRGTTGTSYPLKQWFFRGHYTGTGEAAFNAANAAYTGLQLAWNSSTNGATPGESDIVPHLKFYLQVQTNYTGVSHSSSTDNITYEHDLLKGLIGLDSNFVSTIMVTQGQGGPASCASLGTSGSQAGEYWFTQPTSGILSFYGVTNKVDASTDLATANFATKFPMISYVRYTGETGFGAGTGGGGGSVTLTSADPNVSTMIGGTAQTMTTTSFEFDGNVNITGDLSVTGSGAGTFKGVHNAANNNILVHGNNGWSSGLTGVYNSSLGWAAGMSLSGGSTNGNTLIGFYAGLNITTGQYNIALGKSAMQGCTTGSRNIAIGNNAMGSTIGNDGYCIAIGETAMQYYGKDSGTATNRFDIAIGYQAMLGSNGNSGGEYNVALGHQAMRSVTTATSNVCIGRQAGYGITTGYDNVFVGKYAGNNLTTGYGNVCIGENAGNTVTTSNNVYIGKEAGKINNTAAPHTFIGMRAGQNVVSSWNVAVGYHAGYNGMGNYNVAIGDYAFGNGAQTAKHYSVAIGYTALQYATHSSNTAVGYAAGGSVTTAGNNVFMGAMAGFTQTTSSNSVIIGSDAGKNSTAGNCTFIGYQAGYNVVNSYNIAIGYYAMKANANNYNVAIGDQALSAGANTSKSSNVAIGYRALEDCTHYSNVAIGSQAATDVTTGYENTYLGYQAGKKCTTGYGNVVIGTQPMGSADAATAVTGSYNVAIGRYSLRSATSAAQNVTIGMKAGYNMTIGNNNTCVGYFTGQNITTGHYNTCMGYNAAKELTIGTGNVCLGMEAGYYTNTAATGCIFIGRFTGPKSGDGNHSNKFALGAPAGTNSDTYRGYDGAFLWGDFNSTALTSRYLRINGHLGIGVDPGTGNGIRVASGDAIFDNNVGIGTTSPKDTFEVNGWISLGGMSDNTFAQSKGICAHWHSQTGSSTRRPVLWCCTSDGGEHTNISMWDNNDADGIAFRKYGSYNSAGDIVMFIKQNGNVGIGNLTNPAGLLDVKGADPNIFLHDTDTSSTTADVRLYFCESDANGNPNHCYRMRYNHRDLIFSEGDYGGSFSTVMSFHEVTPGGALNVGINTTTPAATLEVNGTSIGHTNTTPTNPSCLIYGEYGGEILWIGHPNQTQGIQLGYNTIKKWSTDNGATNDALYFNISGSTDMCISAAGKVGIGTTGPKYPLDVMTTNSDSSTTYWDAGINDGTVFTTQNESAHGGSNSGQGRIGDMDSGTHATYGIYVKEISAHFKKAIWVSHAGGVITSSDERIKTNIIDVPDDLALETVRNIPCRYYNYKDTLERGLYKTIGFIAQEVKNFLPMAVSEEKQFIPDEMRKLENISWNDNTLITDLSNCSGVKYKFYVSDDSNDNNEVMKEIIGNSDNTFTFDTSYNNVFCYGKEVDDFHTLDKQKLFALNFSATQELDRQQQADKAKIAELETKVATLESELAAIKQHLGI